MSGNNAMWLRMVAQLRPDDECGEDYPLAIWEVEDNEGGCWSRIGVSPDLLAYFVRFRAPGCGWSGDGESRSLEGMRMHWRFQYAPYGAPPLPPAMLKAIPERPAEWSSEQWAEFFARPIAAGEGEEPNWAARWEGAA